MHGEDISKTAEAVTIDERGRVVLGREEELESREEKRGRASCGTGLSRCVLVKAGLFIARLNQRCHEAN